MDTKRWMAVAAVWLMVMPAWAKDCSVTSTGLPLPDYHRSLDLDLAMSEAVQALVPLDRLGNPDPNGRITIETIGNSNSKVYGAGLVEALRPFVRADVRLLMNGYSKKTVEDWGDPASKAWASANGRIRNAKYGAASVGIVVAYMTKKWPDTQGLTTEEDIDRLLETLWVERPNARLVLLADMGYYGYVNQRNALGYQSNLSREALMFAERARTQRGVPPGKALEYFPVSADGLIMNPLNGLTWPCARIKSDGIHPTAESQAPVGQNQAQRLITDQVFARLFR